jgi:hypothetical protein
MWCALDECGKEFFPSSWQQVFCSKKCRDRFHNRKVARAKYAAAVEAEEDRIADRLNGHVNGEPRQPLPSLAELGLARKAEPELIKRRRFA